MTLYKIAGDLKALNQLMEEMVDEDGNPREPTDQEIEIMREWFEVSYEQFQEKFDNYCRFIKNLRIEATIADEERKAYKSELDRLSKRSKAYENRAKALNGLLWYAMQKLELKKYKTSLFSAGEQNTQVKIEPLAGSSLSYVPEEFLKPRELDTQKVKDAIKDGLLKKGNGTPLGASKLFFINNGKELKDVRWVQGTALMIR